MPHQHVDAACPRSRRRSDVALDRVLVPGRVGRVGLLHALARRATRARLRPRRTGGSSRAARWPGARTRLGRRLAPPSLSPADRGDLRAGSRAPASLGAHDGRRPPSAPDRRPHRRLRRGGRRDPLALARRPHGDLRLRRHRLRGGVRAGTSRRSRLKRPSSDRVGGWRSGCPGRRRYRAATTRRRRAPGRRSRSRARGVRRQEGPWPVSIPARAPRRQLQSSGTPPIIDLRGGGPPSLRVRRHRQERRAHAGRPLPSPELRRPSE